MASLADNAVSYAFLSLSALTLVRYRYKRIVLRLLFGRVVIDSRFSLDWAVN
jgi:hypothetical protein